jgi:hypothetical protein
MILPQEVLMNGFVTLAEVARRINVSPSVVHRHVYYFETVPPPMHRFLPKGRRFYYSPDEADDVVARLLGLGLGGRVDPDATTP